MVESVTLPVLTQDRESAGDVLLPSGVFDGPVRRHLLYEAVKMRRANLRAGTASTKTRGAVRGGGRKLWRQKGTGRARVGSNRSPVWVGGGTTFGPQPRDYGYRMPRSARRAALRSALALRVKEGKILILDRLEVDPPKTRMVVQLMKHFDLPGALILTAEKDERLERAARNLPHVKVLRASAANVYDILRYGHLLLLRDAIDVLKGKVAP